MIVVSGRECHGATSVLVGVDASGAATLGAVPATQIAQNLAFINWTVLTGLALGLVRGGRPAPAADRRRRRGYLAVHDGAAPSASGSSPGCRDGALPPPLGDSPVVVDPAWDAPASRRRLLAFCVLAAPGAGRPAGSGRRCARPVELAAVVAGGRRRSCSARSPGAAAARARSRCSSSWRSCPRATGGVFAAMILGHWYLVTPKLPEAPLILLSRVAARRRRAAGRACSWPGWPPAPGPADGAPFARSPGRGRCSSGCA